jgi:hypothetical protein
MSDQRQKLQDLTTEELEAILQEDFNKAPEMSDAELVLCVLELLEQRAGENVPDAQEAYASFQANYLPVRRGGDSLYAPGQPAGKKRMLRWAVGFAAAVAAVAVALGALLPQQSPNVPTEPPVIQQPQPKQFRLQPLTANSMAITDKEGNFAAVGTLVLEQDTITAAIDAMQDDDGYVYTIVVTYTYGTEGNGQSRDQQTQSVQLSTEAQGREVVRITRSPNQKGKLLEISVTFTAVEKDTQAKAMENIRIDFTNLREAQQ